MGAVSGDEDRSTDKASVCQARKVQACVINAAIPARVVKPKPAEQAGLSERQEVTALGVASVHEADFERQVEKVATELATALNQDARKCLVGAARFELATPCNSCETRPRCRNNRQSGPVNQTPFN